MAKLTPKPWSKAAIRSLLSYGRKYDGPWDEELEEECFMPDEDDASLVTASPQMYEALSNIRDEAGSLTITFGQKTGFAKIYDIARAALRAAEGDEDESNKVV